MNQITHAPEKANFHHLVMDIAWFGLALPATTRFLSVYAIRLGASPIELGLLASLPAIGLFFSSAFSQWWLNRYPSTVSALYLPALLFRLVFLLPAFAPLLPLEWQSIWLIIALTLPAIPQGIAGVVFLVMLRESVEDKNITALVSRRALAMNMTVGVAALAFGLWLDQAPFPFNYQAMFVVAFLAAMISFQHCNRVQIIFNKPQATDQAQMPSPWKSKGFRQVAWAVIVTHIAFFAVFPLVPLYLVDHMGAAEDFMAMFAVAELGAAALVSNYAERLIRRFGNRSMMAWAMVGTAIGTLIVALAPALWMTLIAAAFLGASWTAVGIALFGFFTENTPPEASSRYTMIYHQVISLAMFIGPMLGTGLVDLDFDIVAVLLVGAVGRLLAAVLTGYSGAFRVVNESLRIRRGKITAH